MQHKEQNGLKWLEFKLLADIPELCHGVFTRQGGHSQNSFSSLNIGYNIGDLDEHVDANIHLITKTLGLKEFSLTKMEHKTSICEITPTHITPKKPCDGMMTDLRQVGLAIAHADCQAAIFYDPINQAIANVHSGWRGSVQNIYKNAIEKMKGRYGTKPENLLICISPSLGPEDSEFVNYRTELPEAFLKYQIKPNYFDFWAISRDQLKACGVLPHHIELASISTYSNTDDYFSYRKEKVTGRNCTVVALK